MSENGANPTRLSSLDGLRGLAAMAVVFQHAFSLQPAFWLAYSSQPPGPAGLDAFVRVLSFTPAHLVWAGNEAVAIFFVLSGLVLSLPFWTGRPLGYTNFVVRRLFRLCPVYLFAVVLSGMLFLLIGTNAVPNTSDWFGHFWVQPLSLSGAIRAVLFLPGDALSLDAPLWTLIHEMRISLVLPLILIFMRRRPIVTTGACVAVSLAAKLIIYKRIAMPLDLANLTETAAQLWYFAIGALIARHIHEIPAMVARLGRHGRVVALVAALVLICSRWELPMPNAISYLLTGVGASLLIVLALAMPAMRSMLDRTIPQFLGRISYSIYVLHFPLIFGLVHLSHFAWSELGTTFPVILGIALALVLSTGTSRWIEAPGIRYGRSLAMRLKPARPA